MATIINGSDNFNTNDVATDTELNNLSQGLFANQQYAVTDLNRTLSTGTTWVQHLSVPVVVSNGKPIFANINLAMTYESASVNGEGKFILDGQTYNESPIIYIAQQSDANRARGSHGFSYIFGGVADGNYTLKFMARNNGAGASTWILNYYLGQDTLIAKY